MRAEAYVTAENRAALATRWLEQLLATAPPRNWFTLNPRNCALLVVDMNRYFTAPDGPGYFPAAGAIVSGLDSLIKRWRRGGGPVVYTRHGHTGNDRGPMTRFFRRVIADESPFANLNEQLCPAPGELVVSKQTYDAFHETILDEWLRARGVTQVLVCGVLTQMCCETTARTAFCRGYEVFFAVDGSATTHESLHLASLSGLVTCAVSPITLEQAEAAWGDE